MEIVQKATYTNPNNSQYLCGEQRASLGLSCSKQVAVQQANLEGGCSRVENYAIAI